METKSCSPAENWVIIPLCHFVVACYSGLDTLQEEKQPDSCHPQTNRCYDK